MLNVAALATDKEPCQFYNESRPHILQYERTNDRMLNLVAHNGEESMPQPRISSGIGKMTHRCFSTAVLPCYLRHTFCRSQLDVEMSLATLLTLQKVSLQHICAAVQY